MKIVVTQDHEIDETGVTTVWAWKCPYLKCQDDGVGKGAALYWENAVKGARNHVKNCHINKVPGDD